MAAGDRLDMERRAAARHAELTALVWQWIADANNGNGADSGDLIHNLERAGFPCPEYLREES